MSVLREPIGLSKPNIATSQRVSTSMRVERYDYAAQFGDGFAALMSDIEHMTFRLQPKLA